MKLWLKTDPSITAQTLRDVPLDNGVPAIVSGPDYPDFYAVISLAEWSETEIVPAPESVPKNGWLVIVGDDPSRVSCAFYARETDAAVATARIPNAYGYVPVIIQTSAMITPTDTMEAITIPLVQGVPNG